MLQQQNPVRGFLASVGLDPEIVVEFQYNPTQISDKRSVNYATLNAPGRLMPLRQYTSGGDRTLSFTVRVDGVFTGSASPNGQPSQDNSNADNGVRIARDESGSIEPELNKYRAFLYPAVLSTTPPETNRQGWKSPWQKASMGSFAPFYKDAQQFASPPLCRFGFGYSGGQSPNRIIDCIVTEVSINELLFNAQMAPLRADVSISLVEFHPSS
ncbi:MAG: hypothetical protein AB4042_12395 [Leptolyngbyaceae cyanobacterium]